VDLCPAPVKVSSRKRRCDSADGGRNARERADQHLKLPPSRNAPPPIGDQRASNALDALAMPA
jgi:hypothetical protein